MPCFVTKPSQLPRSAFASGVGCRWYWKDRRYHARAALGYWGRASKIASSDCVELASLLAERVRLSDILRNRLEMQAF
jgi:hypothetical protein